MKQTDLPDTTIRAPWVGWLRLSRQPWKNVTEGDTPGAVSAALFRLAKSHQHCDTMVLTAGVDPKRRRGSVGRKGANRT